MKSYMKILEKIKWPALVALLLSPFLLAFLTIKNSRDCSQFVIDTYELHSGINIPEVNAAKCYYDEERKIRISVYDLNSQMTIIGLDLIKHNGTDPLLEGEYLLAPEERPGDNDLYFIASGRKYGRNWKYVLDNTSHRLWSELVY